MITVTKLYLCLYFCFYSLCFSLCSCFSSSLSLGYVLLRILSSLISTTTPYSTSITSLRLSPSSSSLSTSYVRRLFGSGIIFFFLLVICLLCKIINFIKRPSYHPQSFFFQLVLCSTFHQHPPLLSEMIKVDVFYLPPSPLYLLSSQYNQINLYT